MSYHCSLSAIQPSVLVTPTTLLESGTLVRVHNLIGTVLSAKMVQSSNKAGKICLHECEFTHQAVRDNLKGTTKKKLKKAVVKKVNYSFIIVLCSCCDNTATEWAMRQSFCRKCFNEFVNLHAMFNQNV